MRAERGALAVFLALLVWAPFPLGSNRGWAWTLLEAGLFLSAALWTVGWMQRRNGSLAVVRAAWPAFALLGAWLAYLALQWTPLPAGLVRALSPQSAAMHALAAPYAEGAWITFSIDSNASVVFWLKSCAWAVALALSRHATRSTVILIASLIAIDIAIVGSWFGVEKTVQRIEQTAVGDVEVREDPTVYALEMARDYPLFGTGAGTFATAFMRYRGPDILDFYDHAHNDYTQFLVETGALGAALVASLPLMALVLALSRRRDPLARGFAFAVVMGVSSIAIHSTVDFNLQIPANALAFMVLLAYGWIALHLEHRPGE
jgi:hypothetical protein